MSRRIILLALVGVPLVLLAASPSPSTDDLVRQGNAAFAKKDYPAAIKLYEQAETQTTDPGLVACNKAASFYQLALSARAPAERLGHLIKETRKGFEIDLSARAPAERLGHIRQAEQHYRCAAEGSDDQRRLRARFGLANSLLQGRSEEVNALKEAIASYRDCLHNPVLDEGIGSDVRHNLEVARLLLLRAQLKPGNPDRPKDPDSGKTPKKPDAKEDEPKKPMNGEQGMKGSASPKPSDQDATVKEGDKPQQTDKTTAGAGNAGALLDETSNPSLSPQQAEADLEAAIKLILEKQRNQRSRSPRAPAGTVKDW